MADDRSYGDILRSASVMGGAQIINYVTSLVRIKFVAIFLGPAGVGVVGLYTSAITLIGTVAGLGIQSSGVRNIALSHAQGDHVAVARHAAVLRRICWLTGGVSWAATIGLCLPLSQWLFNSTDHSLAFAVLGATLLMTAVSGGQLALLQGLRRIGDIARVQVAGTLLNSTVTIAIYAWLGKDGIVPVLLATSAISLAMSWLFASRVRPAPVVINWPDTFREAGGLVRLGAAMASSSLLTLAVDFFTRAVVTRELGLAAAGIYQAAWSLSGMFAGFILTAMGADFYPRLTSVIAQRDEAIRIINEQTEIGILLALPGLLGTIALSQWIVAAAYSPQFTGAADVLVWMVLGVLGRVVSWPMGFIQLAMGAVRWFVISEIVFLFLMAALVFVLVPAVGLVGTGYAFAITYLLYTIGMMLLAHHLIGFRWTRQVVRLLAISMIFLLSAFASRAVLGSRTFSLAGGLMTLISIYWIMRELTARLGPSHRLTSLFNRFLVYR